MSSFLPPHFLGTGANLGYQGLMGGCTLALCLWLSPSVAVFSFSAEVSLAPGLHLFLALRVQSPESGFYL